LPKRRSFPDPPGLLIMRSRTGNGRNVPSFTERRRPSRNPGTPRRCSTSATVMPSTPAVCAPRFPATRANATISVAGSCTRLNRSSNRRPVSAAAHRCSLDCIFATRPNISAGALLFSDAPCGIASPSPPDRCRPSPCGRLSRPRSTTATPPRSAHWLTVRLSRRTGRIARQQELTPSGSRVHCCSLDRGGAQLCPCGLATATPQTFTMAFPDAGFTGPESFPSRQARTRTRRSRPTSTRFEPV